MRRSRWYWIILPLICSDSLEPVWLRDIFCYNGTLYVALERTGAIKSQGIYPMFSQFCKTKNFLLSLLVVAGLLVTACGPISIGQKPIDELSPEEAAERAESDALDKDWAIRTKSEDGEYDDSFLYQKGSEYGNASGGGGGLGSLFSETDKGGGGGNGFVGGVGVNSYLWRATLDTVSFMPLASADPFGGVILTDWHATPDAPGERFKLNIRILGRGLRADGINVSTFRQVQDRSGSWINARIPTTTNENIENAILSKARELRHRSIQNK